MKKLLFFILLTLCLNAKDFKVASYNVENLFDLSKQNSEYKEYIPNTSSKWNQKTFNIKVNNVVKVIKTIDADIIGLQEVENRSLMQLLLKKLPEYKYYSFTKYPRSAVGVGFLSKIKITDNRKIDVKFSNKLFRPILETTFKYENIEFKVFNNHWPSKRVSESYRVKFAKKLQDRLNQLPRDYDYIVLGDFNSNYDEMQSFRFNKKLNNTDGITGINQVLNTTVGNHYITYDDVLKQKRKVNFNLWLDLPNHERFSNKYRKQSNTPDNIIISPALLDTKKISYIPKSFRVFKPSYLYKNKRLNRWQMSGGKYNKAHKGAGYSDHLPIYASFSTKKENRNVVKKVKNTQKKNIDKISDLYTKIKLTKPVYINNTIVIYKTKNSAIVKQKNDRAIYIYRDVEKLKLGYSYNLEVNQIKDYNGTKEIVDYSILKTNKKISNYKSLYLDASKIDLHDPKYRNEVIKDLKGKVKNRRVYFNNSNDFINIYAKNKKILPKNGQTITFKEAHLSQFRGNSQILIHKKSDYKVD